ncbi:MAG: YgjP-like metallopeptidase domain-containing protein [Lachnospiraceae bacterium]
MNHSPRFWSEVEKILTSYKDSRAWLRENGERYVWDITDNRSIN